MIYETLEQFRRQLYRRKAALLARRDLLFGEDHELLGGRGLDLELERIRASLERMARGSYGECAVCHERIDLERLRALPDTDRCARCADRH